MDTGSGGNSINRRGFLAGSGGALAGTITASVLNSPAAVAAVDPANGPAGGALHLTHGTVTGDVTHDSAMVWARGSGPGLMQVLYDIDPARVSSGRARHSRTVRLTAGQDFIGQVTLRHLRPQTKHYYSVLLREHGAPVAGPLASFTTAPEQDEHTDVHFVWGGDTGSGMNNRPPFPAFAAMLAEDPEFFVFNGDTIYGDSTTPVGGPAQTREQYWAKYKENREDPYLRALAARVPFIVNWDDHEVRDGWRGPSEPLMPIGRQAFHDYWPISSGPERIYRSIRWGSEVELFVVDGRQYASPLDAPDGPGKILFGEEQREWLIDGMRGSDATWKVLITSSPLSIIRSAPPVDDYVAYEHELGLVLADFQKIKAKNVVWLTADVHWAQAIEYPRYGMWEFVGCPIGANPRRKSEPLSPTFGPKEHFLALNGRYYGSVRVDAAQRSMAVTLKRDTGETIYSVELPAVH